MSLTSTHWSKMRESGTYAGLSFMYWIHRVFGRGIFNFFIFFVSAYFMLVRGEQRRASKQFLNRHYQHFPETWDHKPGIKDTLRHFREFADTVLDKSLAWHEEIDEKEFDIVEPSIIADILDDSRGQLIIGTHLGNLEYCRGFMYSNKNKIINILIYDRHSANFARAMSNINPDSRLNIFQVDELDLAMILELKNKIENGEWLFIAGDRVPLSGIQRTANANFLGHIAPFPIGPYHLAKTLECPVKLMFAYKHNKKITVNLVPFTEKLDLPKTERDSALQEYVNRFAAELESNCKQVPYQWFNFYNFWNTDLPDEQSTKPDHKSSLSG